MVLLGFGLVETLGWVGTECIDEAVPEHDREV